eukprot:7494523-Lingulodinium_polyedra.AAC.1
MPVDSGEFWCKLCEARFGSLSAYHWHVRDHVAPPSLWMLTECCWPSGAGTPLAQRRPFYGPGSKYRWRRRAPQQKSCGGAGLYGCAKNHGASREDVPLQLPANQRAEIDPSGVYSGSEQLS